MSVNLSGNPASQNPTLFALGDSISIQYGPSWSRCWQGDIFVTARVVSYNQVADAIMDHTGIPKIDLYGFTQRLRPMYPSMDALYSDHVHFIEPVQRLQAAYIAGWLDAYPFA